MAEFVLVHGAFGGGWEWTDVARALRRLGHEAFTPTLTGLGDRAHLAHPDVGLATHAQDIVALVRCEGLRDVVLCGASYGGVPVTEAAGLLEDVLQCVAYVDALVPRVEESAADLLPPWFGDAVRRRFAEDAEQGWRVPVPGEVLPPVGVAPAPEHRSYVARLVPQPARTFLDPVQHEPAPGLPRAFLRCTASPPPGDPIAAMLARARAAGWPCRELDLPHDPQLADPVGTADALDDVIARVV